MEDEDDVLQRLFFKKYGRALPEQEKEKESDVDNIKFVIDLTDEKDEDEMEVATSEVVPVAVVKTEPNEVANAAKVLADRKERRELIRARKALVAFGKTLRKTKVIPEKEAPEVGTDSVNTVKTAEQAEMDAEFEAEFGDVPLDEFDGTGSEFRLYGPEDVIPSDDEDDMVNNV
jgi:glycerol-3-phosphate O-acyltransferase